MRPPTRWLLPGVVLIALLVPSCRGGKSYSFPRVRIDASVNSDGSLSLIERRTFDFHGHFHFAYFTVEHRQFDDVVDFSLREGRTTYDPDGSEAPGHARYEDDVLEGPGGFKFKATWWFDATDQRRTFTIHYRVLCAVDVYQDAAHLLWKFIGEGWSVPTASALVTVHLPGTPVGPPARPTGSCSAAGSSETPGGPAANPPPVEATPLVAGDVRAWGHGPLQGTVRIVNPQTVVLDVQQVAPFTFVEGSILFPAETVPLVAMKPEQRATAILAEERTLAEQANAIRHKARADERRRRILRWVFVAWAAGLLVLGVVLIVIGRRRAAVSGTPRELTEPPEPNAHPARLAMEWAWMHRRVGLREAFRAQLLQLARKRLVQVIPLGTVTQARDYRLTLEGVPEDPLDERFANFLFPGDEPVDLNELKPSEQQRTDLREWWNMLEEDIKERFPGSGSRAETKTLAQALLPSLLAGILLAIFSGLGGLGAALPLEALILLFVARFVLLKATDPSMRQRMARWAAFRRYLKHFSSLTDAPAAGVVIWENYLVFAVALGVADRVEKQVRAIVPMEDLPSPWPGAPSGVGGYGLYSSFQTPSLSGVATIAASSSDTSSYASSSSFSSDSGTGGGFSSGGGEGGGGTGGGAG